MSAYIRWLIAQKRQWHHPPDAAEIALGFRGWHTRGYLPHFDAPGIIQMISFHLADSLPQERQQEWKPLMDLEDERTRRIRLEEYLDRGYGRCELAIPVIAQGLENILLRDDGRRCRLLAWVIMPNHVHILVEVWTTPLSKLVQSWKKLATNLVNEHLKRRGQFWQEDYFDRFIRDQDHFQKAVHYIEKNPLKARLVKEPKDWQWSSAKWQPEGLGLQPVQKPKPS
jgi:putative transposase